LKEAGCHKDSANGVSVQSFEGYGKIVSVLQLSSSVMDKWKREEDTKLMACLNTPDKTTYVQEQLAIHLTEADIMHARLEHSLAKIVGDEPHQRG